MQYLLVVPSWLSRGFRLGGRRSDADGHDLDRTRHACKGVARWRLLVINIMSVCARWQAAVHRLDLQLAAIGLLPRRRFVAVHFDPIMQIGRLAAAAGLDAEQHAPRATGDAYASSTSALEQAANTSFCT